VDYSGRGISLVLGDIGLVRGELGFFMREGWGNSF